MVGCDLFFFFCVRKKPASQLVDSFVLHSKRTGDSNTHEEAVHGDGIENRIKHLSAQIITN